MRVFASIILILTLPVVVLLATILYGGVNRGELKHDLASAGIYTKVSDYLKNSFANSFEDASPDNDEVFSAVLENRFTANYIQGKTERFIDDTDDWMSGKTTTPPVISFHEIKDDIISKNPQMYTELQNSIEEMKKEQAQSDGSNSADAAAMNNQEQMLQSLMQSDFSIPVGKNLTGLKQGYQTMKIALPVSAVLLLISLLVLLFANKTMTSRLRWIGVVFILAAAYGYALTLSNNVLLAAGGKWLLANQNDMTDIATPLYNSLSASFVNKYNTYQTEVSITLLTLAVISLILSFVLKSQQSIPAKSPRTVKKK